MTDITYDTERRFEIDGEQISSTNIFRGMLPHEGRESDAIEVLSEAREKIADLPKTSSSFTRSRIGFDNNIPSDTMLELCGAWRMPDTFRSQGTESSHVKFINPHAPDAWIYSNVFAECECGALVYHIDVTSADSDIPARTEHSDECIPLWRWRARLELAENRREEFIRQFHLGGVTSDMGYRLGYPYPDLHATYQDHGVSVDERETFRKYVASTSAVHLGNHTPAKIGEAFGYAGQTIRSMINEYYDLDFNRLRHCRDQGVDLLDIESYKVRDRRLHGASADD